MKKASEVATENENRSALVNRLEAGFDPSANGILVHAEEPSGLVHGIGPVDLYAPRVDALHQLERVKRPLFDLFASKFCDGVISAPLQFKSSKNAAGSAVCQLCTLGQV